MFMEKYKKEFIEYMNEVSNSKNSFIKFLKIIGVYNNCGDVSENYGGKKSHK